MPARLERCATVRQILDLRACRRFRAARHPVCCRHVCTGTVITVTQTVLLTIQAWMQGDVTSAVPDYLFRTNQPRQIGQDRTADIACLTASPWLKLAHQFVDQSPQRDFFASVLPKIAENQMIPASLPFAAYNRPQTVRCRRSNVARRLCGQSFASYFWVKRPAGGPVCSWFDNKH